MGGTARQVRAGKTQEPNPQSGTKPAAQIWSQQNSFFFTLIWGCPLFWSLPQARPHTELLLPVGPRAGPSPGIQNWSYVTLGSHSPWGGGVEGVDSNSTWPQGTRRSYVVCVFDPVSDTDELPSMHQVIISVSTHCSPFSCRKNPYSSKALPELKQLSPSPCLYWKVLMAVCTNSSADFGQEGSIHLSLQSYVQQLPRAASPRALTD